MRICLFVTGYPKHKNDFSNVYLHRFARSLVRRDIEVHVVAPASYGLPKEDYMDGIYIHRFAYFIPPGMQTLAYSPGIPEKIKTLSGKIQIFPFMLAMFLKCINIVLKYQIDLIHAHWAVPPGFLAILTKKLHSRPVCLTLYGAELFPVAKGNMPYLQPFISVAISNARIKVGISRETAETAIALTSCKDIDIIPDGIDIERFLPMPAESVRKRYGLLDEFLIFASGRMVERKGFEYLIRAMPLILKEVPKSVLLLGGEGPERRSLELLVKHLNLERHVIFLGFISNDKFPLYMNAADVFVLPSIVDRKGDTEGSATILLEAMATETPVIGTRVGGLKSAIKNGIGGWLVDEKSPEQIAEKVVLLYHDSDLRKSIGKMGRAYVLSNYSWDISAKKYIELYNKMLNH